MDIRPIDPITAGLNVFDKIIDKVFPDKTAQDMAKLELMKLQLNGDLEVLKTNASIVRAEAESESFLAANWRPITMLIFVGLIVARWFGYATPGLQEAEYLKLWDIVQIGLNGYVIGRSVEKITPAIADAISARKEGK